MADATTLVPNTPGGVPVDGIAVPAASALPAGSAVRQAMAIKSADGADNGVSIGSDGLMPTKIVATNSFGYHAGISGTVNCPNTENVRAIAAHASVAGAYYTINGGDQIPVIVNAADGLSVPTECDLIGPTIVFTGTDAYKVIVKK